MLSTLIREAVAPVVRQNVMAASGRTSMQRRARSTLLCALTVFVLMQLTLRIGIDTCWPVLRDPTFEIKSRRLDRVLGQYPRPPVTVLMLGSSVTGNAFKATFLEDLLAKELGRGAAVFNMASLGAGPLTEL